MDGIKKNKPKKNVEIHKLIFFSKINFIIGIYVFSYYVLKKKFLRTYSYLAD